jgi:4-carboxymuconolactone decarboxylase
MNRLPPADEKKDPEVAAVFAELAASRGWVSNALRSMGHAPEALRRFASVGDYARYHSHLSERLREIVIITTGRHRPYAERHHVPLGLQAGLARAEIDSLLAGRVPPAFGATDAAVAGYVLEFTSGKPVTDATFQALRAVMSPREITDVTITSAYYVALAMVIATMGVELEAEECLHVELDWQRKKNLGK